MEIISKKDINCPKTKQKVSAEIKELSDAYDLEETKKLLEFRKYKREKICREHSISTANLGSIDSQLFHTQRSFSSESNPEGLTTNDVFDVINTSPNDSLIDSGVKNADVNQFLKRPVLIYDGTITTDPFSAAIDVYDIWSKDPTIRAKLSHYAYFHSDMRIRVTLSSTKFHYGTLMISNQPYPLMNKILFEQDARYNLTSPSTHNSTKDCLLNYLSQSPEHAVMKLGVDDSVEFTIPMLLPKQYARLFNDAGTLITNSTSFDDLKDLTYLYIMMNTLLTSANADYTSDVKIQIYAWCENPKLGVYTATDINITAESQPSTFDSVRDKVNNNSVLNSVANAVSSQVSDEFNDAGPASKIASAVSNIAEKASDIPVIGDAAQAASLVAGASSRVLKFFGFSKPNLIDPTTFVKNVPYVNSSYLEGKDTSHKFTCDPKQSITVEMDHDATGVDNMAFKYLTSRESYFKRFTWDKDDVPRTTTLGVIPVTPLNYSNIVVNGDTMIQPTSLCYASMPFTYWRGTISFRFSIVASTFQSGKLMFIFEPNALMGALINTGVSDLNQQHIYILDIAEDKEITIDIGFSKDVAFGRLKDREASWGSRVTMKKRDYDTSDLSLFKTLWEESRSIGNLYIRPFTTLVSPGSASDAVYIECYTYSNDMELAVPDFPAVNRQFTAESQPKQSSDLYNSFFTIGGVKTDDNHVLINDCIPSNNNIFKHYFGEKIESFRALLKRDNLTFYDTLSHSATKQSLIIPMYPCFDSFEIPHIAGTSVTATPGKPCLFNYLRLGYMFCKGGYRHRLVPVQTDELHPYVMVNRRYSFPLMNYTLSSFSEDAMNFLTGGSLYHLDTNGGIEFELPYYSQNLFHFSNILNIDYINKVHPVFQREEQQARVTYHFTSSAPDVTSILFSSAGDDFSFLRFQGAPFWVDKA